MPNLKNAEKSLRQSKKRGAGNKVVESNIERMRRDFRKLIESGKVADAQALFRDLGKALDKAVTKKVMKPNTAARVKSRSAKKLAKSSKK